MLNLVDYIMRLVLIVNSYRYGNIPIMKGEKYMF